MIQEVKKLLRGGYGWYINFSEPYKKYIPTSLKKTLLGKSICGNDIVMHQYGLDISIKTVLLNFGMHGNEVGTVKLAMKLLEALDAKTIAVPKSLKILIIPCMNPDGFNMACGSPDYFGGGRVGKFNGRGVELVKNISSPENHQQETHMRIAGEIVNANGGSHPFSEPESQVLRKVIEKYSPDLFIDFHNAYPCIGGETTHYARKIADEYRKLTGWGDRSELYVTPDHKRYQSIGLNTIFVEGTNRWASDWEIHRKVLPQIFEYLITTD